MLNKLLNEYLETNNKYNLDTTDIENMSLVRIATEQNFFIFDNIIYMMREGVPMGSPFSGPLSEIYLNYVEKLIMLLPLAQYIMLWNRYVHDIFCIWAGTEEELRAFFNTLNIKFKIKFTLEKAHNNSLNFLDLKITLNERNTTYDIYRKPTQADVIIP